MHTTLKRETLVVQNQVGMKEWYQREEIKKEKAIQLKLLDDWVQHQKADPEWKVQNDSLIREWTQNGRKLSQKTNEKTDEMPKDMLKTEQNEKWIEQNTVDRSCVFLLLS